VVLRAYFDDSEDKVPEAKPRMLVYAGYVATEDQWKAFREDWNAVRKAEPAIEFFKMSHAMEVINPHFRVQYLSYSLAVATA